MVLNVNINVRVRGLKLKALVALERHGYTTQDIGALCGTWEGPLWEFAAIFGPMMHIGAEPLFEGNSVEVLHDRWDVMFWEIDGKRARVEAISR